MAWNGARHLSAWYGAAGMGAVLHTLNPRLFLEQIAYIANHAGDRLLIADPATADLVEPLLPQVPSIEKVIFFCGRASLPETRFPAIAFDRSDAHTSDLQSLMRISFAGLCRRNNN